jgi:hypothetical protein
MLHAAPKRSVPMHLTERTSGDIQELHKRADAERDALRRDRYRAVLLALDGKEAVDIAEALGRARRSVQDWAYSYRDGGINLALVRVAPPSCRAIAKPS